MAAQATILHTFPPAVMVLSDATAEASRIEAIRLLVADSLSEVRPAVLDLDMRVNNALEDLRDDDELMESVSASLAILFDAHRQQEIEAAKIETQSTATTVADVLDRIGIELNLVQAEVSDLPTLGQSSRQLKVTGASGVSKEEAMRTWATKRNEISGAWDKMTNATASAKQNRIDLNGRVHSNEEAKNKRLKIKDDEELAEAMLDEIYSQHYGDGSEVLKDKEPYKPFPLPTALTSLNYDAFKKKVKTWIARPCTIKKYYLVLHDIDYSFDAVNAVKAMHMLPPDTDPTYLDPSAMCSKAAFINARKVQWQRLHKELADLASETVKTWMDRMHSVGQDADVMIEIPTGDGQNFVYAMLSEHVEFTANDQQKHTTILMKLHDVFHKPSNPIQAVEMARLNLRKAREVGVHPEYDLGGKDAITAMSALHNNVYKALDKEKLLDPDALKHPHFDQYDCGKLLQAALTTTFTVLQKQVKLDDRQNTGKRKTSEAGADILGMNTEVGSKLSNKAQAQITAAIALSTQNKSLSKKQVKSLNKATRTDDFYPGNKKFEELELKVEACALVLTSGDRLEEPTLRKQISKLQGDTSWKKRRDGGKDDAGKKRDRDSAQGDTCPVKGCTETLRVNQRTSRNFTMCYNHFAELRDGKKLVNKTGIELSLPPTSDSRNRNGGNGDLRNKPDYKRRRAEANEADVESEVGSEGSVQLMLCDSSGKTTTHTVDAQTITLINEAKRSGMRVMDKPLTCSQSLAMLIEQ